MAYHKEISELTSLEEVQEYLNAMDYLEENKKSDLCDNVYIVYSNGQIAHTKGGPVFGQRTEFAIPVYDLFIFDKEDELKLNNKIGSRTFVLCKKSIEIHLKWKELYHKEHPQPECISEEDVATFWALQENAITIIKSIAKNTSDKLYDQENDYNKRERELCKALNSMLEGYEKCIKQIMILNLDTLMDFNISLHLIPESLLSNELLFSDDKMKALKATFYELHKKVDMLYPKYKHLDNLF